MKNPLITLVLSMTVATSAFAWPDKPIKLVVPFPAGGTSDVLGRLIGAKLSESLGQPVIVDNRPGSSGNLGADVVAKSPADGHTLVLMDVGNLVIAPSLYKLPFDVLKDFTPVAMVAYSPHLLVVSNKMPVKTMDELIAYAKTHPGKVNYAAAAGMGSATHIAGVQFAQRSGIQWNYVPYKGGSQAMNDLVGGHVDVTFNGMVATYPHVKADKIRLIAVSSASRQPEVPNTPTVGEKHPGFLTGSWQGLLAPSGTPQAAIDKLHTEILRITALPEIQEKLVTMGAQPSKMSPADFASWLKAEIPAMAKIVKDEKITLE